MEVVAEFIGESKRRKKDSEGTQELSIIYNSAGMK